MNKNNIKPSNQQIIRLLNILLFDRYMVLIKNNLPESDGNAYSKS